MRDWTTEDRVYALATAAACALIALLIAGNFGLGPVPLDTISRARAPDIVLLPSQATGGAPAAPVAQSPSGVLGTVITPPDTTGASGPALPPEDRTPASSTITTPSGAVVTPADGGVVSGTVTDDSSGVRRVLVSFQPLAGGPVLVEATVKCADAGRRSCTWTAAPPSIAGSYEVSSRATDRAGNTEPDPRPTRTVTVVTTQPGGSQRSGTVVDRTVETVGETFGGLVRAVTGLLGL